ncbi:MAG: YihY/virulence factor BrkB family protein [Proteobacteria bacterium]|nr:YihY/virulence factor BrkB family protein [Pseudomonadota bacterium]
MKLSGLGALVAQTVRAWVDDKAPSRGAALAYYTLFSMAPLLLIVVAVAGLWLGPEAARGEVFAQVRDMAGEPAALAVEGALRSVSRPEDGVVATLVGLVLMLVGATTVFAELQATLDLIWRAPPPKATSLWSLLRARVLSFGLILGLGFLLVVSLALGALVAMLQKWWMPHLAGWVWVHQVLDLVLGLGLMTLLFALIYKVMPRVQLGWRDVWVGALVTAVLLTLGRWGISFYLGHAAVASGYGAAGSLVAVLVWVYYSAQIFLLGAEFTAVWARTVGSHRGRAGRESTGL